MFITWHVLTPIQGSILDVLLQMSCPCLLSRLHPHEARNMLLKSVLKPPRRDPIQLPTATYDDDDLEDDPGDDDYDDGEEEQYEQL